MNSAIKLHSKYNPQKEADRFADNIKGNPLFIIITEPGESYLASSFRKKFPKAKLIAVRYTDSEFLSTDMFWDFVWRPKKGNLKFFLINIIPDEYFPMSLFLQWKPSESIWKEISKNIWKEISETIKIIQSILNTRNYFGKRWCTNILKNIVYTEKNISFNFNKIEDSLFIAAGKSLEKFPKTKTLDDVFVLSTSSAISSLTHKEIKPELCISTDGGFWAGEHLKKINHETALAFPLEAFIPTQVLNNSKCVLLNYGSFIEEYFIKKLNFSFLRAKRNGTVSGTAAELLIENTKGKVFAAGLDLSYSKGFSHARPNMNLQNSFIYEQKINPISNIISKHEFDKHSINIYAAWFSNLSQQKSERIFRIGNEGAVLKNIKQVSLNFFLENCKKKQTDNFYTENRLQADKKDRKQIVCKFLKDMKISILNNEFIKKILNTEEENLEKEFCRLVSFSEYLKLMKQNTDKNNKIESENLKSNLIHFIEKEEKKYFNYRYLP